MDMIVHRGPIWRSTALSFTHNYRLRATVYHFKCEGLIPSISVSPILGLICQTASRLACPKMGFFLLAHMDAIGLFQNTSSILSAASPIKVGAYYGKTQLARQDDTHSFPTYTLQSNTKFCAIAQNLVCSDTDEGVPGIYNDSVVKVIAPGYGTGLTFRADTSGDDRATASCKFLYTTSRTLTISFTNTSDVRNMYVGFMMVVIEYGS